MSLPMGQTFKHTSLRGHTYSDHYRQHLPVPLVIMSCFYSKWALSSTTGFLWPAAQEAYAIPASLAVFLMSLSLEDGLNLDVIGE